MRGVRTLAGQAKRVWGGIEAEIRRKMQHFGENSWETAHIYVYNQDDRKPALCSLASAAGQTPRLCKNHVPHQPSRDLFCSAVKPSQYKIFSCACRRSIALASRAVWPIVILVDNICASHELQLGLLQNALDNLVPRVQQIHRA